MSDLIIEMSWCWYKWIYLFGDCLCSNISSIYFSLFST